MLLSQGLADLGYRVALVSLAGDYDLPDSVGGVSVIAQRRSRTAVLRDLEFVGATAVALKRADAAVVVQRAAGAVTGVAGMITRARGRRFVYSSANVIDFEFDRLEHSRRNVALFQLGVRVADRIIVQTDEQAELSSTFFRRDATVIKSLAEPADQPQGDPDAFLWVGRLTHYKRPEAFVALARALPEARFRMVAVPFAEEGERLLAALREDTRDLDNFELLEPRPRDELLRLYESAVAVVNTADYEGMPNIFLEAWSRGIPTLTLTHDPDAVIATWGLGGRAGGDPDAFVTLARELWGSRRDRNAVAARCRDYVAAYHAPDVVARRWADALGLPPVPAAPSPAPVPVRTAA